MLSLSIEPISSYRDQWNAYVAACAAMQALQASPSVDRSTYENARRCIQDARACLHDRSVLVTLASKDRRYPSAYASVDCAGFWQVHSHLVYLRGCVKRSIRQKRMNATRLGSHAARYWYLRGGVHTMPNEPVTRMKHVKKTRIKQSKSPKCDRRHVAVEIEFICTKDQDELVDLLAEHSLENYVQLKTDGSVTPDNPGDGDCTGDCRSRSGCPYDCGGCSCETEAQRDCCSCSCECRCSCNPSEYGHEIAVIMLQAEYHTVIRKVCRLLNSIGAYVNKSCGLHVHIDMRDRNASRSYWNLFQSQRLLQSIVPRSRVGNSYCLPITHGNLSAAPSSRYHAINAAALDEHNTLEIRLHQGSTQAAKINHWVNLLLRIVDAPRFLRQTVSVPQDLLDQQVHLNDRLKAYLKARIEKFSPTPVARSRRASVAA